MIRVSVVALLIVVLSPSLMADTGDTAVFRVAMRPENEVPPVISPGSSAVGTITARVTRNALGNIDAASVIFDVDYTVAVPTTFTGLHIHQAAAGVNGSVVIGTDLSGTNTVVVPVGSGRITRVVNYTSTDTAGQTGIRFVTGLLAAGEQYYVNIHSTTASGGLMRGQLARNNVVFRPALSPLAEVPAIRDLDAEGAALIEIQVNRDNSGAITSGRVTFDVDYRFAAGVTITGLHIHNAAAGVNGSIVIDSGLNNSSRAITSTTGRGSIFRVADIDATNTTAITALTGIMSDPTQFYLNFHTSTNPGGAIRGQLSNNEFYFFNQLTGAEEVPPITTSATADSMSYIRVNRDATGNVVSGSVGFNVAYVMGSAPITFTGLHFHNAAFGTNGGVIIDSGITGANPVIDSDGEGSISREVSITSGNALDALKAIVNNPEGYYVNLHTVTNPGGIIRSQLAREEYHFRTAMSPANEVPAIVSDAAATGWLTAQVNRDASGAITGGAVTFDVNHVVTGQTTFTGLHIHDGPAGSNGPIVIDTGITATAPVVSATGSGNITRTASVTSAAGIAALNKLITAPDQVYVNLHTITSPGGLVRAQLLPVSNSVGQAAGGGDWISVVTVRNPSATSSVNGIVNFMQSGTTAFPAALTDPNISFWIPPSSSATFNLHNRGTLTSGFASIYSSSAVNVDARYLHPDFSPSTEATTVTARSVSIPVNVNTATGRNTGIAIVAHTAGNLVMTLTDSAGVQIAGGSRSVAVTADQHVVGFVRDLLPQVTQTQFTGTLTITANATTGTGRLSALALQLNGNLVPLTVTSLP